MYQLPEWFAPALLLLLVACLARVEWRGWN
jgi:hypothetical protein